MVRKRTGILVMLLLLLVPGPVVRATPLGLPEGGTGTDHGGDVYNVKAYGALGTGTNDTVAIQAALAAIPATGGVLYFPPGRYLLDYVPLTKSHVTWLGAGPALSLLQTTVTQGAYATAVAAIPFDTVTFDSLGLDGNNTAAGWYLDDTSRTGTLTIRHCRLTRFAAWSVYLKAPHFVLDRNQFEGDGTSATENMQGVILQFGAGHGTVTNNTFRYVYNALIGDAGGEVYPDPAFHQDITAYVEFSRNFFDLGVYTKIPRAVGSGAGVTYSENTLRDPGATFAGFTGGPGPVDFLRVMPLRTSGTATIVGTKLTDTTQNFATVGGGVLPGDMVRVGGRMGIVTALEEKDRTLFPGVFDTLHVEEWLSEDDRSRLGAPASPATYDVWGIYLGKYVSHTASEVTVKRWMTLNGTNVTPAPGTRYELLPKSPNYALHCEPSCQRWHITNNIVLRPYSDGLSYYGSYAIIANNHVGWGQDVGITVNGVYHVVDGNHVAHQGTFGIACDKCYDSVISNNTIVDSTWENPVDSYIAGIAVLSGRRTLVSNNAVGIESNMPLARYGISVAGDADDNVLMGNTTRNHLVGGLRLDAAGGTVNRTRAINNLSFNETPVSTSGPRFLHQTVYPALEVTVPGTARAWMGALPADASYIGLYFNSRETENSAYNIMSGTIDQGLYLNRPPNHPLMIMHGNVPELHFDGAGQAIFKVPVQLANPVHPVSPTAPNRTITLVIDGITYYIPAKTTND